jgi:hypothetical protein
MNPHALTLRQLIADLQARAVKCPETLDLPVRFSHNYRVPLSEAFVSSTMTDRFRANENAPWSYYGTIILDWPSTQ